MVLSIPDTGLHLESSAKSADALPLQAFALTLSDNVIEDLIQQVQNGGDVKLSLGNVPVSACAAYFDMETRETEGGVVVVYCSAARTIASNHGTSRNNVHSIGPCPTANLP